MKECKVIAITNQKGGVGKTTTTVNLGARLALSGHRILLIDADPQGSLTVSLGNKSPDELQDARLAHTSLPINLSGRQMQHIVLVKNVLVIQHKLPPN